MPHLAPDKIQVTSVIRKSTHAQLVAEAEQQARSLSALIRYILEQYCADQDDDQKPANQ